MGIETLTQNQNGQTVIPDTKEDWLEWVSATDTRNFLIEDPLLDWLKLYGEDNGFQPDADLPRYDSRTDFTQFIFKKGNDFEAAVVEHLKTLTTIITIGSGHGEARSLEKAEETFAAMEQGVPVIYQGILRDADTQTYGLPDLLVRSDELARLFPDALQNDQINQPASDLRGAKWHYRVLDIKFTTLHLLAGGELGNSNSAPAYKAQLYIYNRALGRLQGYTPPVAYLLGRSWEQTVKKVTSRGRDCLERLAPVFQDSTLSRKRSLAQTVEQASVWIRHVRKTGMTWSVLPEPTVPELRPNMGNTRDAPFSAAKKRIAQELEELTLLWNVGAQKRRDANDLGIYCWRDPKCNARSVGITGQRRQPVLQAILDINRSEGPPVAPPRVTAAEAEWRAQPDLEFYVDLETVSDLDDDFSQIPNKDGQPLIFMIGCGHMEEGDWRFKCFTVDALTEEYEALIIDAWLTHMDEVRQRLAPNGPEPLVIHWSPAETTNISTAYNAATRRHPQREQAWTQPRWFDFLREVIKEEPVVVRGALGFGLKKVVQAIYNHGLIETNWDNSPLDGLGAMVGAWWCAKEGTEQGVPLIQIDLMQSIATYNEVDCKVMMEIVQYLRAEH